MKDPRIIVLREKCKKDLKFLCKDVLGMKDWQDGLHDELAIFLKQKGNRKLILIPRHHLKSSLVSVGYVIQQMLVKPNICILLTNATLKRCEEMMHQIQNYLKHGSALKELFGEFCNKDTRWTIDQFTIAQRNKATVKEPTLSIASLTTNVTGGHYDLIVNDDLVERGNIGTSDQIQKVKDFFKDCLNLSPRTPIITIGTRWAVSDLYGDLLEHQDFNVFLRPATDTNEKILFPNMVCKDRSDPKWQDKICLESQLEMLGPYEFNCQFMNNPISDSSIEFKRPWIQHFDMTTDLQNELHNISGLLSVDPAFRLKETSDYSGLVVTKTTEKNVTYILEAEQKKVNSNDLVKRIMELVRLYNIKKVLIETQSAQIVLLDVLRSEMAKQSQYFVVEEVTQVTRETKAMRIRGLIPHYANGRILHRRGLSHLEAQLIQFPRTTHDDIIDALSQQLKYWRTPSGKIVNRKKIPHYSWDWWVKNKLPDTRTKDQKKFSSVIKRRNWI